MSIFCTSVLLFSFSFYPPCSFFLFRILKNYFCFLQLQSFSFSYIRSRLFYFTCFYLSSFQTKLPFRIRHFNFSILLSFRFHFHSLVYLLLSSFVLFLSFSPTLSSPLPFLHLFFSPLTHSLTSLSSRYFFFLSRLYFDCFASPALLLFFSRLIKLCNFSFLFLSSFSPSGLSFFCSCRLFPMSPYYFLLSIIQVYGKVSSIFYQRT